MTDADARRLEMIECMRQQIATLWIMCGDSASESAVSEHLVQAIDALGLAASRIRLKYLESRRQALEFTLRVKAARHD